jgi:hypothetical protein
MAIPTTCSIANPKGALQVQGVATLAAVGDATIIAAPGTGKHTRVQKIIVTIHTNVDESFIAIEDGAGGSVLAKWRAAATDGMAGTTHVLDYGESGIALSANAVLNLTVEAQNSTVYASAVGFVPKM